LTIEGSEKRAEGDVGSQRREAAREMYYQTDHSSSLIWGAGFVIALFAAFPVTSPLSLRPG
jgi:hypothetical protein